MNQSHALFGYSVDIHYTVVVGVPFSMMMWIIVKMCCAVRRFGGRWEPPKKGNPLLLVAASWLAGGRSSVNGHHDGHISDTALLEASSSKYVEKYVEKYLCVFVVTRKATKLAKTAKGAEFSLDTQ
jgi:hypothetical protein